MKIFALLLLISYPAVAQVDHIGTGEKLQDHPRILMVKGEEETIKKNDPVRSNME